MGLFAPPSVRNNDASTRKLEDARASRYKPTGLAFPMVVCGSGGEEGCPTPAPIGRAGWVWASFGLPAAAARGRLLLLFAALLLAFRFLALGFLVVLLLVLGHDAGRGAGRGGARARGIDRRRGRRRERHCHREHRRERGGQEELREHGLRLHGFLPRVWPR